MSLDEFLHHLHFNIEKASPPDWEVDWNDAPLAYKLYCGLPVVPLSLEIPLTLEGEMETTNPDLQKVGHFLWYVYGLTQFSESIFPMDSTETMQSFRRYAPSGGALYPSEIYVYLTIDDDLPHGVYHYDAAHHRLVLLREGNCDLFITKSLGYRCEISECFATVFVSTMFWKNFFKYNNFAYRLQGLDAGVLIGHLLEVGKRFDFESRVFFQFLDRSINHLLGLTDGEESVYAVIPLSVEAISWDENKWKIKSHISADDLCRELPEVHTHYYTRSSNLKEYPMLTKMNKATMLESTEAFRQIKLKEMMVNKRQQTALPSVERFSYDLAVACQKRFSPATDFVMEKISQLQLATLLQEAITSFSYHNDMDGAIKKTISRVTIYGCLTNIEGIPNGAYEYNSAKHTLQQVHLEDFRPQLQLGMPAGNINLFQVPICLHVAGDVNHLKSELGYRGYRIQQMEAGMLVQRLLLVASAIGLGGHPLLGFDAALSDEIYKTKEGGKTCLIQIPVGPFKPRSWLRGSLHS